MVRPKRIGVSSLRTGDYYTVVSVELGNTTTKCIVMSTNLHTAEIFEIAKEVRFTRDVRLPKQGESSFGHTLAGTELTRLSVTELVANTLVNVMRKARLSFETDLHFVVRSTGVTAGFARPEEVGEMVKALADGCLQAGVPPGKMTASLTPENLPPSIREFTWLKKVYFDGAVASCLPPANTEVVANEMEGELVTAGLKGAAKSTTIDFRNPVMVIDFGTTLAGRVTDDSYPYARTIGSFAGLAGAIPDSIAKGSGLVDMRNGCMLDLPKSSTSKHSSLNDAFLTRIHDLISVETVASNRTRVGAVPVNPKAARESDVVLIGVDVGTNGSRLHELQTIGAEIGAVGGLSLLHEIVDDVMVHLVQRILDVSMGEGLVLPETSLGLTGRGITTGKKPKLVCEELRENAERLWTNHHQLLFVEDGLAMGAAVAARCMNSMGTRENPMGGRKGGKCIMGARMKRQSRR